MLKMLIGKVLKLATLRVAQPRKSYEVKHLERLEHLIEKTDVCLTLSALSILLRH
jgi:hypothetical protein